MYKLNKGQKLLLKMAKKGMITDKIKKDIQDIIEEKVPNPALSTFRPITLVDDQYDGPEDRSEQIEINPDHKENKITAYMMKKFGMPFGLIYDTYLKFYTSYSRRSVGQYIRRLKEHVSSWRDIDFNGV